MKPKLRQPEQDDLLRPRLVDLIDMRHELVKLEGHIDWNFFEREWAGLFPSHRGRPATSPRLVAGLLYLQHAYDLSDETVVRRWVENPYYQHFCGETFFLSGQKRGVTPALRKLIRRRSAIEPTIGHMKTDGRLRRCPLKGVIGDALFAVLCGCGQNIRLILAHLRKVMPEIWDQILAALPTILSTPQPPRVLMTA